MRRFVVRVLWLLVLSLSAQMAAPAGSAAEDDLATQAKFTTDVLHFITWPAEAFDSASAPIVIALLGDVPYADELKRRAALKKVKGRSLEIRSVERIDRTTPGHVVVMGSTSRSDERAVLDALDGSAVVSIALSKRFASLGGTLSMIMHRHRVMFEVNQKVAEQSNIKIGSRLLRLASVVY
jgi:hypothetical protein